MNTREIYDTLKSLGAVDNADSFSHLFGYKDSTIRAQFAKGLSPDLGAWVRLWFALNEIATNTEIAIKTALYEERSEYEDGLEELQKLQFRIWNHISVLASSLP